MRMFKGNLWDYEATWRAIPTNGSIKSNGDLVMGAGVALQARARFPQMPKMLGAWVAEHGNLVAWLSAFNCLSFPTKNHWLENSDLDLIDQSCQRMMKFLPDTDTVAMPKVGCGLGGLDWNRVFPVLLRHCDDRIVIVSE